jgi:putative oxidoreductase
MTTKHKNVVIFVARVLVGLIFLYAGWAKLADMSTTIGFFQQLGIVAVLAYAVSIAEFVGGILLILGLWTHIAATVLAVIMLGAIWYSHTMGFQGIMPPLGVFSALLYTIASGAGAWALGKKKS